jgi:hypothetical protein
MLRLAVIAALLAAGAAALGDAAAAPRRVWVDRSYYIKGETEILEELVHGSRGRMTVNPAQREPPPGPGPLPTPPRSPSTHPPTYPQPAADVKGFDNVSSWDLYWTVRPACHKALPRMQPGQRVSCAPGVQGIVSKQALLRAAQAAYGERAFGFSPRSYLLPEQYWVWRNAILNNDWADTKLWGALLIALHWAPGARHWALPAEAGWLRTRGACLPASACLPE